MELEWHMQLSMEDEETEWEHKRDWLPSLIFMPSHSVLPGNHVRHCVAVLQLEQRHLEREIL